MTVSKYRNHWAAAITHTYIIIVYFAKGEPRNVEYCKVYCGNAIYGRAYGCSGLGNCRMLTFLPTANCVIDLISMLIMWNHSITNIFRIKPSSYTDLVFVSIPAFSPVRISNKIVKYSHRPPKIENQHGRHIYDEVNRKFAITFWFFKIQTWFKLLCYLVPSSRIRPLATVVAAPLHPALSLASLLMLLMVASLEYHLSVSSHLCIGLPLLLAPFILPSITSSSIPPALTTCPK